MDGSGTMHNHLKIVFVFCVCVIHLPACIYSHTVQGWMHLGIYYVCPVKLLCCDMLTEVSAICTLYIYDDDEDFPCISYSLC